MSSNILCTILYLQVSYPKKLGLKYPPFPVVLRSNSGYGLLILEDSITHKDATLSVGLLWTSDQFVAKTST
jgi:hypothetical protein